jgi:hypothetical protein
MSRSGFSTRTPRCGSARRFSAVTSCCRRCISLRLAGHGHRPSNPCRRTHQLRSERISSSSSASCITARPPSVLPPHAGSRFQSVGCTPGVAIVGAIGSGKSSACMYPYVEQLLAYRAHDPSRKVAALMERTRGSACSRAGRQRTRRPSARSSPTGLSASTSSIQKSSLNFRMRRRSCLPMTA